MKPELLAPCGSQEALIAAVAAGADAVYLSGIRFGARKSATNFDHNGIREAVHYAHERGVRVYCTVNTLIKDDEVSDFLEWTDYLYGIGTDALILQDIGMIHLIKDRYPGMELHGSTQMSAHHESDFTYLESLGLNRVVAAREMSAGEIAGIKKKTDLEIEVFFHGALCVCYSGQCLMSSLIGGRSGNRGACAQSCRQLYTYSENETAKLDSSDFHNATYRLSTKDLEMMSVLSLELLENVNSIKIEGRMKRPEYVYTITSAYRKAIDGLYERKDDLIKESEKLLEENRRIFSRGGSRGLLGNKDRNDAVDDGMPGNRGIRIGSVQRYDAARRMLVVNTRETLKVNDEILVRTKNQIFGARVETVNKNGSSTTIPFKHNVIAGDDVYRVTDDALLQEVRERYRIEESRFGVHAELFMELGKPAILKFNTDGICVEVIGEKEVEKALKQATSKESAFTQLSKLGGTPYALESIELRNDGGGMVPASELNGLRRAAIEKLGFERHKKLANMEKRVIVENDVRQSHGRTSQNVQPLTLVSVHSPNQIDTLLQLPVEAIYCPVSDDMVEYVRKLDAQVRDRIIPRLPRILDPGIKYGHLLETLWDLGVRKALIGSYGGLEYSKRVGILPIPDWSLNIINSQSMNYYTEMGVEALTLSYELNEEEICEMARSSNVPLEIVTFGKQEAMVMKYCINPCNQRTCETAGVCHVKRDFWLTDKTGARFEASQHDGLTTLYNSAYLFLTDEIENLKKYGISRFRLEFTNESPDFINTVVSKHLAVLSGDRSSISVMKSMADRQYMLPATKGHYKRGII